MSRKCHYYVPATWMRDGDNCGRLFNSFIAYILFLTYFSATGHISQNTNRLFVPRVFTNYAK